MRLTNKFGLPDVIVRANAFRNSQYDAGSVHRSITQLIQPPRIDRLRSKHYSDMEVDVSDEWFTLLGSAVHQMLEWGAEHNMITEERIFTTVDGWRISGMLDTQTQLTDGGVNIADYKVTSAYSLTSNDGDAKDEWIKQLNMQSYLVEKEKGLRVNKLEVIAIIRDWVKSKALTDPNYPQSPVLAIQVPKWDTEVIEQYIVERIRLHRVAEMMEGLGKPLPECTPQERWESGTKWAVVRTDRKKAVRVFTSDEEADKWMKENLSGAELEKASVEHRPGVPKRCQQSYCMVSRWCDQWAVNPHNPKAKGKKGTANEQG